MRKTSEFVRDMASSTAKNVTKMMKDATDNVLETTENVTEKAKGTLVEGAKVIKDEVAG